MNDTAQRFHPAGLDLVNFHARHFLWRVDGKVATITLNRPERKNPLTLESYAELRDTFRNLVYADSIKVVVISGAGDNFCSGGDVHEIIGPLVEMQRNDQMAGLLAFTRMTGDLVKAMRACPQPIVAAVDGVCAGAGAILAMASDLRYGTARSKIAFLFVRVGLAGADMGAHLARHDLNVEVRRTVLGDIDVADVLLSHAADSGSDFIVMGGYGHSRLREFVLGGVTRSIFRSMTAPVLMSH